MSDKKIPADPQQPVGPTDDPEDVEGHSMWLNPGSSYDLAKSRSKEIERQAREHQRQKEARAKGK
jgi:hypothetical protein